MPDTLYLHVGTRKSGTTTLQTITRVSEEPLLAAGVGLPFGVPQGSNRRPFMANLRRLTEAPHKRQMIVAEMRAALERAPQKRAFFSSEGLARLPVEAISGVMEAVGDTDLQVIITVRDLARQIPSEWQQSSKLGSVPAYEVFCQEITDPETETAQLFTSRYDVADIAARWGGSLGPEKVHIVILPQVRDDNWLPRTFFGLMGVDSETLNLPEDSRNTSMGYTEAELLRHVVAGLPEDGRYKTYEIHAAVRRLWKPTEAGANDRIGVPETTLEWCRTEADRQIAAIRAGGWHVVGDLDDLRPSPKTQVFAGRDSQERELAVATEMLGRFLTDEIKRSRQQQARAAAQRPSLTQRLRARAGRAKRMTLARASQVRRRLAGHG